MPIITPPEYNRFVAITGGPSSGKSTLIEALRRAGFCGTSEVGRQIIKDQMRISGKALPWVDPHLFAETMLSWETRSYRAHIEQPGTVFFDRGISDVIGYLRLLGLPVPDHMMKAAELFRYNRRVFICPPWREIFEQDAERKQTVEEAERTYDSMARTYADFGYDLMEIPRVSVERRMEFVLNSRNISLGNAEPQTAT